MIEQGFHLFICLHRYVDRNQLEYIEPNAFDSNPDLIEMYVCNLYFTLKVYYTYLHYVCIRVHMISVPHQSI